MGVFLYEARNRAGELFAGTIEAKDKREAARALDRLAESAGGEESGRPCLADAVYQAQCDAGG